MNTDVNMGGVFLGILIGAAILTWGILEYKGKFKSGPVSYNFTFNSWILWMGVGTTIILLSIYLPIEGTGNPLILLLLPSMAIVGLIYLFGMFWLPDWVQPKWLLEARDKYKDKTDNYTTISNSDLFLVTDYFIRHHPNQGGTTVPVITTTTPTLTITYPTSLKFKTPNKTKEEQGCNLVLAARKKHLLFWPARLTITQTPTTNPDKAIEEATTRILNTFKNATITNIQPHTITTPNGTTIDAKLIHFIYRTKDAPRAYRTEQILTGNYNKHATNPITAQQLIIPTPTNTIIATIYYQKTQPKIIQDTLTWTLQHLEIN